MPAPIADKFIGWDTKAFLRVEKAEKSGVRRRVWRYLSRSADGPAYLAAICCAAFMGHGGLHSPGLAALAIGFGIELPLYIMLKNRFKRTRPFRKLAGIQGHIQPPDEFSFPSGHSAGAFLVASVASIYMPHAAPLLLLWACGVGYSRVALGVHYPGDVLAGAALGCLAAVLSLHLAGSA